MADTIEALLQENLGKVQELQTTSENLQASLTRHVAPLEANLTDDVIPAITAAIDRMNAFGDELPKLEAVFEKADGETGNKLEDIDRQIESVDEKLTASSQEANKSLDQIETESNRVFRSFDDGNTSARSELDRIEQLAQSFLKIIQEKETALNTSGDGYVSGVAKSFAKLETTKDEVVKEIIAIEEERGAQLDEAKNKLDQALAKGKEKLDETATKIEMKAKELMNYVMFTYGTELGEKVDPFSEQAIEDVKKSTAQYEEEISEAVLEVSEIDRKADRLLEIIQSSASDMDGVKESLQ